MLWIHGKAQFTRDKSSKIYTTYGPFSSREIAKKALFHIWDTIARKGGIRLNYFISPRKFS